MSVPVSGIVNVGNTCFMNTAIQCMIVMDSLSDELFMRAVKGHTVWEAGSSPKRLIANKEMSYELSRVLKGMMEERCVVRPSGFMKTMARVLPRFANGAQHDSHEFLIVMLEYLHKAMGELSESSEIPDTDNMGLSLEELANWDLKRALYDVDLGKSVNSMIVGKIYGQEHIKITCPNVECGRVINRFPLMCSWSVEIVSDKLEECLKGGPEALMTDEWLCESCGKRGRPVCETLIWRAPEYLIIHLKRFSKDMIFMRKNDKFVDFPLDGLDVSEYMERDCEEIYDCVGIGNHMGNLGFGHYFAYVRRGDDWFEANDTSVRRIVDKGKLVSNMAYYMIYRRRK